MTLHRIHSSRNILDTFLKGKYRHLCHRCHALPTANDTIHSTPSATVADCCQRQLKSWRAYVIRARKLYPGVKFKILKCGGRGASAKPLMHDQSRLMSSCFSWHGCTWVVPSVLPSVLSRDVDCSISQEHCCCYSVTWQWRRHARFRHSARPQYPFASNKMPMTVPTCIQVLLETAASKRLDETTIPLAGDATAKTW